VLPQRSRQLQAAYSARHHNVRHHQLDCRVALGCRQGCLAAAHPLCLKPDFPQQLRGHSCDFDVFLGKRDAGWRARLPRRTAGQTLWLSIL
jgi:hypothetical protein